MVVVVVVVVVVVTKRRTVAVDRDAHDDEPLYYHLEGD